MIHELNNNTRENLKNELRNDYPNLTDVELNKMDESVENFISSVSLKIQSDEAAFAEIVREKLLFIKSKAI